MQAQTALSIFGPKYKKVEIGDISHVAKEKPLKLDCGAVLSNMPVAFQSYGKPNSDFSNVVLICHALTSDQYVVSPNPVTGKPGWWENIVGPGKPIDTNRFYVICPNVLGGCMGTVGPKSINPDTKKPYALDFPVITIADMVRVQKLLLEKLGIKKLYAAIGGSMGGMQVLQWMSLYPEFLHRAVCLATAARHTAQNIAFHEIGRQAIIADPDWQAGKYLEKKTYPSKGLSVARMTAHVTYLSDQALHRKFGRELQNKKEISYGFEADFQVESYLRHQGVSFINRFDPNSYLYITKAMDYFDLFKEYGGDLSKAFAKTKAKVCVASFSSDWLFPTEEAKHIVRALAGTGNKVSFVEIETDKGHDAFLLEEPSLFEMIKGFLAK